MKRLFFCLTLSALLSGCSLLQQQTAPSEDKEHTKTPPPMYLGEVHQVYPSQGFALLRIIGPMPKAGVTLITHPVDGSTSRMGNLAISADSAPRNGMAVADIRSGTVVSGDRVFLYRDISLPEVDEDKVIPDKIPVEKQQELPTATPPLHVEATRADLEAKQKPAAPAPAVAPAPSLPEALPETPQPAHATSPQLPTAPITLPAAPEAAPSYLNDIPDSVDGWN